MVAEGRSRSFIYSNSRATHHDDDITSGIRFWGPLVSTQSSAARGRADEHLSGVRNQTNSFASGHDVAHRGSLLAFCKSSAHCETTGTTFEHSEKDAHRIFLGADLELDELRNSVTVGRGRFERFESQLGEANTSHCLNVFALQSIKCCFIALRMEM